jgi:hypothetical protein
LLRNAKVGERKGFVVLLLKTLMLDLRRSFFGSMSGPRWQDASVESPWMTCRDALMSRAQDAQERLDLRRAWRRAEK